MSATLPIALASAVFLAVPAPAWAQQTSWPTTQWVSRCNDGDNVVCDLQDSGIDVILNQFTEMSRTFETLGFRPPNLERTADQTAYIARMQQDGIMIPNHQSGNVADASGVYFAHNQTLQIAYSRFFAFDTEDRGSMYAATHELFHAIQNSYPVFNHFMDARDSGYWLIEGMAEAAAAIAAGPDESVSALGTPYLDHPLYDLTTKYGGGANNYVSYPFWLFLAEEYGGGMPAGVSIMHDFMLEAENYLSRRTPIAVVDGALRPLSAEGLYDIYPAFIADYGRRNTGHCAV